MRFEDLKQYDYMLPPELIRKNGVEPRDAARLFVYDTRTDAIHHDYVFNLAKYLPGHSLMILNETRVVPARLWLRKETGGKIEVFVLANEIPTCHSEQSEESRTELPRPNEASRLAMTGLGIPVLVDRKVSIGQKLLFPDGSFFEVTSQEEHKFFVRLESKQTLEELLDRFGETPLPHYLEDAENESPLTLEDSGAPLDEGSRKREEAVFLAKERELRKRYQTVFAKTGASVAAPTASLHFTDRVFESFERKNIDIAKVTLDVGLGTFAPLQEKNFLEKRLHRERIDISSETAATLNEAKRKNRKIIAVGTTALRTLESIAQPLDVIPSEAKNLGVVDFVQGDRESQGDTGSSYGFRPYSGSTDIFIFPPHTFRSADILMTNFHLPKTSLMLLVDAFLGHKKAKRGIMPLYKEAIRKQYAFYSFGDSMLIL